MTRAEFGSFLSEPLDTHSETLNALAAMRMDREMLAIFTHRVWP